MTSSNPRKRRPPLSPEERARTSNIYRPPLPAGAEAFPTQATAALEGLSVAEMERLRDQALTAQASHAVSHAERFQYALLSEEEERALTRTLWEARESVEGQAARATLIERNLRLVSAIAHYYAARMATSGAVDVDDLRSEGVLGLMRALDLFDPRLGYRFSTYATFWIRQAVARELASMAGGFRLPEYVRTRQRKLQRAMLELEQEGEDHATLEQAAERVGLPLKEAEAAWRAWSSSHETASLDASLEAGRHDEDEVTLLELLPDEMSAALLEEVERRADALLPAPDSVLACMARIERRGVDRVSGRDFGREMRLLRLRYLQQQTLVEVGAALGVSRERARQLELQAIVELRVELAKTRRRAQELLTRRQRAQARKERSA